jgi:hypothetical protein
MKTHFLFVHDCSVLDVNVGSPVIDKINARNFKLLFEINREQYKFVSESTVVVLLLLLLLLVYSPFVGLGPLCKFLNPQSVGLLRQRDRPAAQPLFTLMTTQTQEKYTNIYASRGIRTNDLSV